MKDYGWTHAYWNSNKFSEIFYRGLEKNQFYQATSLKDLKSKWPLNLTPICTQEYAYYVETGEESKYLNLFHHIRNAFAHGRFRINQAGNVTYFYFENVSDGSNNTFETDICKVKVNIPPRQCTKTGRIEHRFR